MGVPCLWSFLKEKGLVRSITGRELHDEVEGRAVAVDVSGWIVQAHTQKAFTHDLHHVRLVFNRLCHYIRLGVLPVVVLEGPCPIQKADERCRRIEARIGTKLRDEAWQEYLRSSGYSQPEAFRRQHAEVQELVEALGLPVLQANGEAEYLCAWLNEMGLVDGVATEDGDALALGAPCVYRGLRLHTDLKGENHKTEKCLLPTVETGLQLSRHSLLPFALLVGCDMLVSGAKTIGPEKASVVIRILQSILSQQGKDGRERAEEGSPHCFTRDMFDLLQEKLRMEVDEVLIERGGACRTCQHCRHGSVRKGEHGALGCTECGTHASSKGGNGKGGCLPASKTADCPCDPCRRKDERVLHQLAKAAQGTPGYITQVSKAREAYEDALRQAAMPSLCEEEVRFRWRHRPSVERLRVVLGRAFTDEGVISKILPLLLEWDLRQAGPCLSLNLPLDDAQKALAIDYGFLFLPSGIQKVQGSDGAAAWRYVMTVEPVGEEAVALLAEATERANRKGSSTQSGKSSSSSGGAGALYPEKRSIRMTLIKECYPSMVEAFKKAQDAKTLPSRPSKARKGTAKLPMQGTTLDRFFASTKKIPATAAAAGGAAASKDKADARGSTVTRPPPTPASVGSSAASSSSAAHVISIDDTPPPPPPPQADLDAAPDYADGLRTPVKTRVWRPDGEYPPGWDDPNDHRPRRPDPEPPGAPHKKRRSSPLMAAALISGLESDDEQGGTDGDDADGFYSVGLARNLDEAFSRVEMSTEVVPSAGIVCRNGIGGRSGLLREETRWYEDEDGDDASIEDLTVVRCSTPTQSAQAVLVSTPEVVDLTTPS